MSCYVINSILGGRDDPTILIWDIDAKSPICVCKKTYDRPFVATKLKFTPNFDHVFLVGGQDAVHVWNLNEQTKKASNFIIPLGKIKRTISDMVVCSSTGKATADYLFCATQSGDIVKLYVDFVASDGSKNASVVATQIKKASSKKGMNAGKFTGGKVFVRPYFSISFCLKNIFLSKRIEEMV